MAGVRRALAAPSTSTRQRRFEPLRTRARIAPAADALKEKHLKEALWLRALRAGMQQRAATRHAPTRAPPLPARRQNRGENFSHPTTLFTSGFAQLRKLLAPTRRGVAKKNGRTGRPFFSGLARISCPRRPALRHRRPVPAARSTRPCWTARPRTSSLRRRRLR